MCGHDLWAFFVPDDDAWGTNSTSGPYKLPHSNPQVWIKTFEEKKRLSAFPLLLSTVDGTKPEGGVIKKDGRSAEETEVDHKTEALEDVVLLEHQSTFVPPN